MKNLINTTLALLFAANLSAQNPNGWIEEGAEFYHQIQDMGSSGYARYFLDEEFEVNGIILQRLRVEEKTITQVGPNEFVENNLVQLPWSRLFHTSNDTVYFANESGELRFAWHLNPQVGDVWDFGAYPLFSEPSEMIHAYAKVTNIQEVTHGGLISTDITIETCLNIQGSPLPLVGEQFESYLWTFHQGKINTLFGLHSNFHYLGFYEISPTAIYCPSGFSSLACYRSATIDLTHFLPSQSCTGGVSSIENNHSINLSIYPNPATTSFTITHPEHIQSVQIYDIQGRLQLHSATLPFDVRSMTSGVYWVQIETLDGQVNMEKLVVD